MISLQKSTAVKESDVVGKEVKVAETISIQQPAPSSEAQTKVVCQQFWKLLLRGVVLLWVGGPGPLQYLAQTIKVGFGPPPQYLRQKGPKKFLEAWAIPISKA